MLASLNFVEKFISLPKKKINVIVNGKNITKTIFDTTSIAPLLTRQGFEVESIRQFGGSFDTVVVGRIERFEKHPDASRLSICFVNINENDHQLRQIVCGAKNVRAGMYVAVALPGTQLPGVSEDAPTFEIKSSVIRNIQSNGMLCARSELRLGVNADVDGEGIWDLGDDAQGGAAPEHLAQNLGMPVFMTLGLEDTLLDLSVTPNRPDMLCQQGVARELAAGFRYNQIDYEIHAFDFSEKSSTTADVILNDVAKNAQGMCAGITFESFNDIGANAFFVLIELTQPQNKTPAWLRNLLEPLNQNSINLIVDVSNFILVAYGQPNHTFDLDSIDANNPKHKKLVLRHAHAQESFTGLDDKERTLHEADCVVSDSSIPQALLGVVGGERSKIKSTTRKIVVEFANPNPASVRHTARRHSKQTVASFIFEKGIDVGARFHAAAEFTALLAHLNDGQIKYCTSVHSKDLNNMPLAQTSFPKTWIPFHNDNQKKILGVELISFETQVEILKSLGFDTKFDVIHNTNQQNSEIMMMGVPSWRLNDVVDTADLVEECVRVVGIDHVPAIPIDISATVNHDDVHLSVMENVSDQLCALGYHEVKGLNFMRVDDTQKLNFSSPNVLGEPITILNPVLGDEPLMQTTLIPDLLRKIERNVNYGIKAGQIFCSARTFYKVDNDPRPIEINTFAGACFGHRVSKTWQNSGAQSWTLHDVMMHMATICDELHVPVVFQHMSAQNPWTSVLHPKKQVEFSDYGWLGELHPKVKRNYGIVNTDIFLFEINFETLLHAHLFSKSVTKKTNLPPRFPLLSRDFSFIVGKDVTAEKIEHCVQIALQDIFEGTNFASLKSVQIFDIYHGESVAENKKSVTFKVIVEPEQRTFTEHDIQNFSSRIVETITKQLGGEQRV